MKNFFFQSPTEVYFGKGQISQLAAAIRKYGQKILLVYGGESIKHIGLYGELQTIFQQNGIEAVALAGVEPNPRIESVRKGVALCRSHGIEAVLAVGGGSVIDCAKVVAAGARYNGDPWDLVLDGGRIKAVLPLLTVLTIAASGSEMDRFAVISNPERNDKIGTFSPLFQPKVSILDPSYSFTVPKGQTAAGTADIMSHLMEHYFHKVPGAYVQDRLTEALLKTCIHYGPIAYREPENYEARANLMWASSLAIDGLTWRGNDVGNTAHPLEHQLSAYYDITHGVGLAIITPHWMDYILNDDTVEKFAAFGVHVWDIDPQRPPYDIAKAGIQRLREFFATLEIPARLRDVGIGEEHLREMAAKAAAGLRNPYYPLTSEDILTIYRAAL